MVEHDSEVDGSLQLPSFPTSIYVNLDSLLQPLIPRLLICESGALMPAEGKSGNGHGFYFLGLQNRCGWWLSTRQEGSLGREEETKGPGRDGSDVKLMWLHITKGDSDGHSKFWSWIIMRIFKISHWIKKKFIASGKIKIMQERNSKQHTTWLSCNALFT